MEVNQIKGTEAIQKKEYLFGFSTDIETETLKKGLDESVIEIISKKRNEPQYILDYRMKSYEAWKKMQEPIWADLNISKIDFQNIHYYSAPKNKKKLNSLDDLDPKLKETYDKLGLPISEQKRLANVKDIAIDLVFDSVSIFTTFKDKLKKDGVIFCSIQEAMHEYPEILKKYLGSVVPHTDNFYAALNSAVFSDGSFVYIPPNTRCPMDLSTYFRINTQESGQFERTLIVCDENSYVSYLEGCTAPSFNTNQLHAAVVELVALKNSEIKYSTIQNWYAGNPETGEGGIYNFVTKRGSCLGENSKISWTQIETGSAITWKYPSCILKGKNSIGEFYSVALTNHKQQADTGTKMIHIGENTKSTIISKGISADQSKNSYRGLVQFLKTAKNARNYTQCDSMLVGKEAKANTYPYIVSSNSESTIEHEATTSKISEDQLLYLQQRGIKREDAISLVINGFCKDVFQYLPLEFAVEASKLLTIKLENSVG